MTEREYQKLMRKKEEGTMSRREKKRLEQVEKAGRTSEGYAGKRGWQDGGRTDGGSADE